eukprot:14360-Heterococcus_DN1.PRE.6
MLQPYVTDAICCELGQMLTARAEASMMYHLQTMITYKYDNAKIICFGNAPALGSPLLFAEPVLCRVLHAAVPLWLPPASALAAS